MTIPEAILLGAIIGYLCSEASTRFLTWVDRRPVSDDLDVQEYAAAANTPYFDEPYDWSASEWDAREAEVSR